MVRVRWLSVAGLAVLGAPFASHAAGTPPARASRTRRRSATRSAARPSPPRSNTSSVSGRRDPRRRPDDRQPDGARSRRAPRSEELVFTLTNTGNGTETFNLTALSAGVVGDDFDPTLATPAIYFDTDNSGDFSAARRRLQSPARTIRCSPRTRACASSSSTTFRTTRGQRQSRSQRADGALRRPAPARRAPVFGLVGDGGVEAVAGTTGGDAALFGEYLVADVQLTAVKSQTIVDQFGGARPLPGARINYQIVVTASGSGTATATRLQRPHSREHHLCRRARSS